MKPNLYATLFVLITGISLSAEAQTTYPITANVSTSSFGTGAICSDCNIVISPGVTVTINSTCSCNNCTFTGGTVLIVPGSNFTLSGTDSFKNETVLISQTFNMNTLVFYGDTVAFNASINLSGGRTDIDSSRVSVNAALTLNKGTIYKDSLHLNSNLTFTNSVDSFAYSNVDVASGAKISANQSSIINTTFGFAGSSSMNVINGMTSTGSNYYLDGTSTISSTSTTLSGDKIVMSGSTNSFSTVNSLNMTNTDVTMKTTGASTFSANSLTASGGSVTAGNNSTIKSTNAINLTNTNIDLTSAVFSGNSLSVSGGSISAAGSAVKITNAINLTGTAMTMTGNSTLTGNSGSLSNSSLTMSGTASVTVTNAFGLSSGSQAYLYGNNTLTANSMSVSGGSFVRIGDGTLANTAHITISNGFSVDNSSLFGISNFNNYLSTTNNSLKNNTISCGGGGSQHSCSTGLVYGCGTISNNAGLACTVLAVADMTLSASAAGPGQTALSFTDGETTTADHYLIQRNANNSEWTTIYTMNAGGYTSGEYHFTDADAPAGAIEYRIERIDGNGKATYSFVASVMIDARAGLIAIHPNPATGGTFYITTPSTAPMVVNIYTMTGQLLLRTSLKGQTQYPVHLPSQSLSAGSIVVQTIGQESTQTFILLVR
ncbi:MAG TPA: hypothetical protein VGM30_02840 [Puia sp.]|jgi:hypothetical protein